MICHTQLWFRFADAAAWPSTLVVIVCTPQDDGCPHNPFVAVWAGLSVWTTIEGHPSNIVKVPGLFNTKKGDTSRCRYAHQGCRVCQNTPEQESRNFC